MQHTSGYLQMYLGQVSVAFPKSKVVGLRGTDQGSQDLQRCSGLLGAECFCWFVLLSRKGTRYNYLHVQKTWVKVKRYQVLSAAIFLSSLLRFAYADQSLSQFSCDRAHSNRFRCAVVATEREDKMKRKDGSGKGSLMGRDPKAYEIDRMLREGCFPVQATMKNPPPDPVGEVPKPYLESVARGYPPFETLNNILESGDYDKGTEAYGHIAYRYGGDSVHTPVMIFTRGNMGNDGPTRHSLSYKAQVHNRVTRSPFARNNNISTLGLTSQVKEELCSLCLSDYRNSHLHMWKVAENWTQANCWAEEKRHRARGHRGWRAPMREFSGRVTKHCRHDNFDKTMEHIHAGNGWFALDDTSFVLCF